MMAIGCFLNIGEKYFFSKTFHYIFILVIYNFDEKM